jgi:hypothetical protein
MFLLQLLSMVTSRLPKGNFYTYIKSIVNRTYEFERNPFGLEVNVVQ